MWIVNEENRQLSTIQDEHLFETVLAASLHWDRVLSVQDALLEISQKHSVVAPLALELKDSILCSHWTPETVEALVTVASLARSDKRKRESDLAGRSAQRAAGTVTEPSLAQLLLAVLEECEVRQYMLPRGTTELLYGLSVPERAANRHKRLKAAIVSAIDPRAPLSKRAQHADVDRGAFADWEKEPQFKQLVLLIGADQSLAEKSRSLFGIKR